MQHIRGGEVEGTTWRVRLGLVNNSIHTSITTPESELPATKLLCTFFKVTLKNGFKASLYPVDFVAACDMHSDGPGGGFCSAAAKKKETKMFQEAEKVYKEKE